VAGLCGLVLAGRLLASNLGFYLDYSLLGPEDSASGTNWVALPWVPKDDLQTASDLFDDLGGAALVESVARYVPQTGTMQVYAGAPEGDFPLTPGEGLIVKMKQTVQYKLIGSHDPRIAVTLAGPETAMNGDNRYAPPYHAKAKTAGALIHDVGSTFVGTVTRWIAASDSLQTYDGTTGADFALVPGQSYLLRVNQTVEYVPTVEP